MSTEPEKIPGALPMDEHIKLINEQLAARNFAAAFSEIKKIPEAMRTPLLNSGYALCLAEMKRDFKNSVNICHEAIKREPKNPEHYFRQGRIMLLAGRRKDCIWVLRMGLRHGKHRGIVETLGALGIRRPPPIYFLPRTNPVNKYLGLLLTRLNLR